MREQRPTSLGTAWEGVLTEAWGLGAETGLTKAESWPERCRAGLASLPLAFQGPVCTAPAHTANQLLPNTINISTDQQPPTHQHLKLIGCSILNRHPSITNDTRSRAELPVWENLTSTGFRIKVESSSFHPETLKMTLLNLHKRKAAVWSGTEGDSYL